MGREAAVRMAEHGASVVVNDLGVNVSGRGIDESPAEETVNRILEDGGEATAHYGDVTDLEYTDRLIGDAVGEYGAVHSVANFAGILRDGMIFNMTEEDWDGVVDVHLKGHFSLLRNAARHWRERYKREDGFRDGVQRSFLCVSSGVAAGNPGQSNYSAAKAGILGLMRTAARELLQYDVRVNALWPSAVTRMTRDLPVMRGVGEEEMGPQFVAGAPVFLAGDEAHGVTGCTLGIAGGNLSFVTDPERANALNKDVEEGPWTAGEIAESWDDLTDGFETTRTTPGW